MGPKLALLFAAGALTLLPGLSARAAEKAPVSYSTESRLKSLPAQPALIQGKRSVLEMIAEHLDLSGVQKIDLQNLLDEEQKQVAALHQDVKSTDAQKSAKFHEIRQKTKDSFVAVLTPDQRREFNKIMGR